MVRLIHFNQSWTEWRYYAFQSHYGSINTELVDIYNELSSKFQSHYGSINTISSENCWNAKQLFQSHYGSINTAST